MCQLLSGVFETKSKHFELEWLYVGGKIRLPDPKSLCFPTHFCNFQQNSSWNPFLSKMCEVLPNCYRSKLFWTFFPFPAAHAAVAGFSWQKGCKLLNREFHTWGLDLRVVAFQIFRRSIFLNAGWWGFLMAYLGIFLNIFVSKVRMSGRSEED